MNTEAKRPLNSRFLPLLFILSIHSL